MARIPEEQPPRSIDKYELLERVGEGGMAVVYRARHRTLGREVAIKLLHPHLSKKERNRIRFEREAMAIESLTHEHIVQIFDYSGKDSRDCYIVTEFIRGATLKSQLEDGGKLPSEVAAMIAVHLCEALAYAHERGFIHRDIKPENVMIREDGVVKLMDFGIARMLDESSVTITGGLVGSPAYMSPEQASDGTLDGRSDLFSLGTLLYRCVTGRLPFTGNSPPVILRNILDGEYPDPEDPEPGIHPGLADVIRKALSVDPEQRYQSANDMRQALLQVLEVSQVDHSAHEIRRYMRAPSEYQQWLETHLGSVLAERGKQLLEEGNNVAALKLFNRALYLDDENQVVLDLLQHIHKSTRPRTRYYIATVLVLLVPIGTILALVLGWRPFFLTWNSEPPPSSQASTPEPELEHALARPRTPPPPPASPRDTDTHPSPQPIETPANPDTTPAPEPPGGLHVAAVPQASPLPETPHRRPVRRHAATPGTDHGPAGDRKRAVRPAVVNISSFPYAEVYINGKPYGNSMFRKGSITLAPGTYRLRLVNPLCEVLETDLVLKEGQIFEKHYRLTPLPARLTIQNLPGGTRLYLDGKLLGRYRDVEQPILIREPRREHTVRAVFPGGEARTWRVPKLNHNGSYRIDGSLSEGERG